MADWVGGCSNPLSPLVEAIRAHVMTADKLHTDDPPVPVLMPRRGTTKLGRLWTYVRDDRNSVDPTPQAVWFAYSPDRNGTYPQAHLKGFAGLLQADAYAGYDELYKKQGVTEVACWAHARRKFFELFKANGSPLANDALRTIGKLHTIEARVRGQPPPLRQQVRHEEARPILTQFNRWLFAQLAQASKKSVLAKTCTACWAPRNCTD
jgi:transposase